VRSTAAGRIYGICSRGGLTAPVGPELGAWGDDVRVRAQDEGRLAGSDWGERDGGRTDSPIGAAAAAQGEGGY
jgi:hypothetical protein